jgi:hypothetical protein
MSLITRPDCGNAVSTEAVACPNCGRPMAPAIVEPIPPREVIIQEVPKEKGFPMWMLAPILILGAVLVFVFIAMMRSGEDESNRNVNVRVAERETTNSRSTRATTNSASSDATIPQTSAPSEITVPPSQNTTVSSVPSAPTGVTVPPTETVKVGRSNLSIEAKIRGAEGREQPVQRETFYLLDEDLETILREAEIEDEEGRGLVNAFGLAVLYPNRYPEINRKALAAINKHVVAKTLTDAQGKAKFPEVKTDRYYLFGITKTRDGFSVWNTPVTLNDGQMIMNLEPSGSGR